MSEDIKQNIDESVLAEVFSLAESHDIANIVGEAVFKCQLAEDTSAVAHDFKRTMLSSVVRYQKLSFELKRVCALFEKEQIPHIPLKGAVTRKLYPDPWMRTSCDVDILVKNEDLERAIELLKTEAGYSYHKMSEHDYAFYSQSGVHIELHYDFLEDSFSVEDAWNDAVLEEGCHFRMKLSDEFFALHHLAHMAKHMKNGGCGLRPFIDLWFIMKKTDLNPERLDSLLAERNLKKFSDIAYGLTENLFCSKPLSPLQAELLNFVLDAGVYGSTENRVAIRQIEDNSKIKYALSRIFPKRSSLKYAYPALEKHAWLMPFCQVHRWVKLILKGRGKAALEEFSANQKMDDKKISNINSLLEDLEII